MSDLSPCPFCGTSDKLRAASKDITCYNCWAIGPTSSRPIEAWNKRITAKPGKSSRVPCPFCGGRRMKLCEDVELFFVSCPLCGARGPGTESKAEAETAWNWRGGQ